MNDPNCGSMGSGAGGGNQSLVRHTKMQHDMAGGSMNSMGNSSSKVRPRNKPSTAGSPVAGSTTHKSIRNPLRPIG